MLCAPRSRTILLAVSLLGSALTPVATIRAVDRSPAARPSIAVEGATTAEHAMTAWAIGRFEAAGLMLPSVSLHFRDDDGCDGAAGLYRHSVATLTICNRGGHHNPPRHTLLHELAHAWSLHAMDDADIAAFLSDQGLSHWTGGDLGYWGQGAERVAEYLAWGLQDSADEDRSIWTYGRDCADLAAAFRSITGTDPLNSSPGHCTEP